MSDAVERGQPFEFDELWRPSTFTIPDFPQHDPIPELQLERLDNVETVEEPRSKAGPFDFEPLQLDEINDGVTSDAHHFEQEDSVGESSSQSLALPSPTDDIWNLDAESLAPNNLPSYCTWEGFEKKDDVDARRPAYLSEAGSGAFDAALAQSQPDRPSGVLPQDVSLRALCNLALGRSSIFFRWDVAKGCFEQTLHEVPISGLSLQCSASFTTEMMEYASMYRQLLAISAPRPSEKTSALMALKRCIVEVMDTVESSISNKLPMIRSLLQLQENLETPRLLVTTLTEVVNSIKDVDTEEQALSSVSDQVHAFAESGNALVGILREILVRVSSPWLRSLREDLGMTGRGVLNPATSIGEYHDKDGNDVDESANEIVVSGRLLSGWITDTDRRLIAETRSSLQIARQHLDWEPSPFGGDLPNAGDPDYTSEVNALLASPMDEWFSEEAQQHRLESLNTRMNHQPEPVEEVDSLKSATVVTLTNTGPDSTSGSEDLGSPLQFDPLMDLRPAIQTQWRNLNDKILRHVFQQCELRKYLSMQHSFHLLGSGEFVAKLSTVLFSSDVQSAERTRGNVPTGATMGLRLGARGGQRWPPASSELRLSLMGVLDEAYRSGLTGTSYAHGNQTDLPGGLSFAIRELSDAEIDQVMDPTSLHALDFLRLQYTAPTPLDTVITPASIQKYDEIFRFLLQLLRVQYVTACLRRDSIARVRNHNSVADRISLELHHVISAIMAYVMDVGISAPWCAFMAEMDRIEVVLSAANRGDSSEETTAIGLMGLRDVHDACIESIRGRLFLKRKHAKYRSAIKNVLDSILKTAPTVAASQQARTETRPQDSSQFSASVAQLVGLLQATVDKPPKMRAGDHEAQQEAEALTILLGQLNWNGFYADSA